MLKFLLFLFGFISLVFSLIVSKDIFSLAKFYIYFMFIYFCSIYFIEQNEFIYPIYIIYVFIGFVFSIIEVKLVKSYQKKIYTKSFFPFISFNIYKNFILNLYQNNNPNRVLNFAYLNTLSFMISGKLLYSEFMNITFDLIF